MKDTIVKNEMWESILNSTHNGLIVIDCDSHVLFANQSAKELFSKEKLSEGRFIQDLIPPASLDKVINEGIPSIGQKMEIANQQYFINITPLYHQGERSGAIGVIQDITRIEHYRSLFKQLEAIIEFSTDGIYVVDASGKTVFVNTAYEKMTGYNRKELIGNQMKDLMGKGYFDQSVSLLVLEEKKQISIIQKIAEKKEVIVTGSPVFDDMGEIELVVTSVRDITQLNEIRRELNKAKEISELSLHRFSLQAGQKDGQSIIFQSLKMKQVYQQVKQVAPFPTSILLSGPSGVGKEVITNLIHHLSSRKDKPLIKINCGAIPESLLESELFGYEKGAFTGARQEGKIGLLELADKGTIMLDEIGEMPLSLQVKLLRVIQEKQIRRIGGNKIRNLDIRIISATNKNLKELIDKGQFREDLYYRLNVIELDIPSLAERPEDIELLADYFFASFLKTYHIERQLSEATKQLLTAYHWPGNVRELKNLIENLVVAVPDEVIEPHHLPLHFYEQADPLLTLTLKQRVEQYERRLIKDAVKRSGSVRKAAKQLGVHHTTLVKKMKNWS
ncbi:PAS domain S-box protein [Peribacillus cavernae]|uniref:HTH-type transcriptional regulatory protein TyrR n=1 Tax=Peribacillus cavernae TaxID=1674310 RepID=A0A433HHJ9_9BACI|nr:sigma 54-interacting transcriptional regulator [Peribacillus cavernae]MDQ0219297.1 PAS domain S-box-containing protein [Peribacillus cavernae]RUQ27818.1 PAS domain S-box protein [Peribacillus cavernae]